MQTVEVSDLEEGEILEYEVCSSGDSLDAERMLETGNNTLKKFQRELACEKNKFKRTNFNQDSVIVSSNYRREGYSNKSLKERLMLANKVIERKKMYIYDDLKYKLDCNLSDAEYCDNEYEKTILNENKYLGTHNNGQHGKVTFKKKHHDQILDGTAEDIMSQIDKTICRKSHCNYKRRKSRNLKTNLENSSNLNGVCNNEDFSSDVTNNKSRKHLKRKKSCSDSDSDMYRRCIRDDFCQRKRLGRRKKDDYRYNEIIKKTNKETTHKKSTVKKFRDFDEVRKCLLEKLKKQKAKEEVNKCSKIDHQEFITSEIQGNEILMLSKKSTSNLSDETQETFNKENSVTESDSHIITKEQNSGNEEDETDLTKLRLIALASNGKRKIERSLSNNKSKADNSICIVKECDTAEKRSVDNDNNLCSRDNEDTDFDRNELLLRAEALKTALLKKHQKRLNKIKYNKRKAEESSSDNNGSSPKSLVTISPESNNETEMQEIENLAVFKSRVEGDEFKEDLEKENGNEISTPCKDVTEIQVSKNEMSALSSVAKSRRKRLKINKKKKRKISVLPSNIKENDKASEQVDEDVRILRSQLLCDLIKKKSLKDLEKKSVLTDSVQTSVNRSTSMNKPKLILKSSSAVKSNVLKKINVSKTTKVEILPKIPKPEIQRIIVHLGSDDSSEDECITAASTTTHTVIGESGNGGKVISSGSSAVVGKQTDESIQASYERSVELLLSEARKKVEGEIQKAMNMAATPEAVYKHLPPSQRLEYIRLKQKIAERERQKKLNRCSSGTLPSLKNAPTKPCEELLGRPDISVVGSVASAEFGSTKANTNISLVVDSNLNASKADLVQSNVLNTEDSQNLAQNSQSVVKNIFSTSNYTHINKPAGNERTQTTFVANKLKSNNLMRSSQKLNSRNFSRKYVATPLAESKSSNNLFISSNQVLISKLKLFLRKIKIEKTIEENYDKEIAKLKSQLSLVSKKRLEQRFKIKKLAEESMKIYKLIKNLPVGNDLAQKVKPVAEENKERKNLEKTCETKESGILSENRSGKNIEQGIREIENGERTKLENDSKDEISKDFLVGSCKEFSEANKNSDVMSMETSSSGACDLPKYTSPLEVFAKASDMSERVNPNVIMCQFDLMGICKDEECNYQHFRTT